jgi:phosphatidate phosphatase LPIN
VGLSDGGEKPQEDPHASTRPRRGSGPPGDSGASQSSRPSGGSAGSRSSSTRSYSSTSGSYSSSYSSTSSAHSESEHDYDYDVDNVDDFLYDSDEYGDEALAGSIGQLMGASRKVRAGKPAAKSNAVHGGKDEAHTVAIAVGGESAIASKDGKPLDAGQDTSRITPIGQQGGDNSEVHYRRSQIALPADLEKLHLQDGCNIIKFKTSSSFSSGAAEIEARIFLYDSSTRFVVSDIDGTVTRSDIFGHILPRIGKDWTHAGICKLYTKIADNGYKFLYLTARSVSQIKQTKNFLFNIQQDGGMKLPMGPLLTTPDRLFDAVAKEVSKRSHEFKISCLKGVAAAFPKGTKPFYAGFGNRLNDAISYEESQIPKQRIFIIDSHSVVHVLKLKQTYRDLSELVHETFPHVDHGRHSTRYKDDLQEGEHVEEEFNSYNFWRVNPETLVNKEKKTASHAGHHHHHHAASVGNKTPPPQPSPVASAGKGPGSASVSPIETPHAGVGSGIAKHSLLAQSTAPVGARPTSPALNSTQGSESGSFARSPIQRPSHGGDSPRSHVDSPPLHSAGSGTATSSYNGDGLPVSPGCTATDSVISVDALDHHLPPAAEKPSGSSNSPPLPQPQPTQKPGLLKRMLGLGS